MDSSINKKIDVAILAARQAGKIILEKLGNTAFSDKAKSNLVTEADLTAQKTITDCIRKHFPTHGIFAEEEALLLNKGAEDLWIIDPLDGTNNFAHTIPHFSISIAYTRAGQVVAGVIFDPNRDEMFTAVKGSGAFLNGTSISVSEARSLQEAIIATGFYYDRDLMMRKTLETIEKLFEANIHGIRRFGSAALDLCWVACGRFDAYFEYKLSPWDFAAGMLILEEAGGKCTDHMGNPLNLKSKGIAVSNGQFHQEFLNIIRWN